MKHIKTILYTFICWSLILISSCNTDTKSSDSDQKDTPKTISSKEKRLNISLLLDLSDRIDTTKYANSTMQYYQRDLGYINSIAYAFVGHLKNKPVFYIKDGIKLFLNPEPQNSKVNNLLSELKFEVSRNTPALSETINSIPVVYENNSRQLYLQTLQDGEYVGSDIWNFFKKRVKDYCIDPEMENILIILTDGYMYHINSKYDEGNKSSYLLPKSSLRCGLNKQNFKEIVAKEGYGFIKAADSLDNLSVLVLGINPSKKNGNPYEGDVMELYWSNWLNDMGVKRHKIVEADLPTNVDQIIEKFLANE